MQVSGFMCSLMMIHRIRMLTQISCTMHPGLQCTVALLHCALYDSAQCTVAQTVAQTDKQSIAMAHVKAHPYPLKVFQFFTPQVQVQGCNSI